MLSSRSTSGLALVSVTLCTLLWAEPARAYCREVTAYPPSGYNPGDAGCFNAQTDGGVLLPLFWRNACVSYSLQKQGSKYIAMSDATRIAGQAFAAWTNAPCTGGGPSISAVPFPVVDCNGNEGSQEHSNLIIFRDNAWPHDDGANVIGYTTLTVDLNTGEIFGANIELNSHDYTITTDLADASAPRPGTALAVDLATVLTHEAGHFLGLAHSADTSAVMFAHYKPGSTTLTQDDINGICSLYTPGGGHDTSGGQVSSPTCMPTPRLGFLPNQCGSIDSGTASFVGSGSAPPGADAGQATCDTSSCAMSRRAPRPAPGKWTVCGLIALMASARRAGRARRRVRAPALVIGSLFALQAVDAVVAREARASVSVAALFDDLVQDATAAAVVTPTEQHAQWEDGRIATYTRVHVDRVVAGELPIDVWVRTAGGAVGTIGQLVEGEARFAMHEPSFVFVRPHVDATTHAADGSFVIVDRAQGQFLIVGDGPSRHLTVATDMGALLDPKSSRKTLSRRAAPSSTVAGLAQEVLGGRTLDDAAREITAVWSRVHRPIAPP